VTKESRNAEEKQFSKVDLSSSFEADTLRALWSFSGMLGVDDCAVDGRMRNDGT
jgi:hypothetical protein